MISNHEWTPMDTKDSETAAAQPFVCICVHSWFGKSLLIWTFQDRRIPEYLSWRDHACPKWQAFGLSETIEKDVGKSQSLLSLCESASSACGAGARWVYHSAIAHHGQQAGLRRRAGASSDFYPHLCDERSREASWECAACEPRFPQGLRPPPMLPATPGSCGPGWSLRKAALLRAALLRLPPHPAGSLWLAISLRSVPKTLARRWKLLLPSQAGRPLPVDQPTQDEGKDQSML